MWTPEKDEIVEWVGSLIGAAAIGYATEPKYGVLVFGLYVTAVLWVVSEQLG